LHAELNSVIHPIYGQIETCVRAIEPSLSNAKFEEGIGRGLKDIF